MAICVIIYFSLCIPFVPDGHDAEFYSFVFIYIAIFLPGLAAYIASDPTQYSIPHDSPPLTLRVSSSPDSALLLVRLLYVVSVCLSDPYAAPLSASSAASRSGPQKGATTSSSSAVPGTVDANMQSQQPAASAAASATGVSLPVSDGAQANGHAEQPMEQQANYTAQSALSTNGSQVRATSEPPHAAISLPGSGPASASSLPSSSSSPPAAVCSVCGSLQSPGTKHCYVDGRCVPGFDHHCVYLNTCVGERNYHLFFVFVSLVTALMTFQLFVTLWLLAHYRHDDYRRAVESSHLQYPLAWLILLTCVAVLPFLCLASITSLQCFHCYLVGSRQTTYQFIIRRRQLMQQRWEAQQQQQWQAEGRAAGADGPVLNSKQQWEQAEWMRERQRQQNTKQRTESTEQSQQQQQMQQQYAHMQQPQQPQLTEEIRSV